MAIAIQEQDGIIPQSHADLLESKALANVATIGPKGEPQVNPVWFGWDGEHICFSLTKGRQKYRNLLREPRVSISITDPKNPFRYLEIRGVVARIDEDENNHFIDSMAKKYTGSEKYGNHRPGDERVIVVVEPRHTTKMGR